MNKEEYYKRIEKINNRFRTDRVSADEEYQLVCQRNYLSTKYIEYLIEKLEKVSKMKNNHMKLLNLSFNGRLKNYYKDDGTYHDYNVGDLLMV